MKLLLPFPKNRNGTRSTHPHFRIAGQSIFPALSLRGRRRDLCFPAKFSRRSWKTKQVQSRCIPRAPTKAGPVSVCGDYIVSLDPLAVCAYARVFATYVVCHHLTLPTYV